MRLTDVAARLVVTSLLRRLLPLKMATRVESSYQSVVGHLEIENGGMVRPCHNRDWSGVTLDRDA
jgi:hypothetical protein